MLGHVGGGLTSLAPFPVGEVGLPPLAPSPTERGYWPHSALRASMRGIEFTFMELTLFQFDAGGEISFDRIGGDGAFSEDDPFFGLNFEDRRWRSLCRF